MDALQYLKEKYEIEGNTHYFREPDLPLSTSLEKVCKYMQEYSDQQNAELRERVKELEDRYNRLNANYVDMVAENTRYRQALQSIATRWNKVAEHNDMRTALHLIQQDVFEALKNNEG